MMIVRWVQLNQQSVWNVWEVFTDKYSIFRRFANYIQFSKMNMNKALSISYKCEGKCKVFVKYEKHLEDQESATFLILQFLPLLQKKNDLALIHVCFSLRWCKTVEKFKPGTKKRAVEIWLNL